MAVIPYKDVDGTTHNLETNAGDVGGEVPKHDVRALPAAYLTMISDLGDKLDSLHTDLGIIYVTGLGTLHTDLTAIAGYVDGLEGYVDGIEGKLDTIHADLGTTLAGYLDGVEGKLDSIHTDLGTTLAGYLDGVETKLDTLHTDLSTISLGGLATTYQEQKTSIGTGSNVQFTSQSLTRGMWVQNVSTGGQTLYLAISGTPSSSNGWYLYPGQEKWLDISNANIPIMRASASGGVANYWGW